MKKIALIIVILIILVVAGFLIWQYWWVPKEKTSEQENQVSEKSGISISSTKLATLPTGIINEFIVSLDGKRIAYPIKKGQKEFLVLDGKEIGPYDNVFPVASSVFSPDSKRFAFFAMKETNIFLVLDGKEMGPYDNNDLGMTSCGEYLIFSSDSKRFAYGPVMKEGKYFVVLDGTEMGITDNVRTTCLDMNFSPDSKRFAYTRLKEGKHFVVLDGKETGPYNFYPRNLTFSPDSKRFAFAVVSDDQKGFTFVLDGKKPEPTYFADSLGSQPLFAFSPDSQHFVFRAGSQDKDSIILDGERIDTGSYDFVEEFIYSPDGKHFAYILQKKLFAGPSKYEYELNRLDYYEDAVFLDGENIGTYGEAAGLTFSPDSQHLAYGTFNKEGKTSVILDSKEMGYYYERTPFAPFIFSPDSQHYAYIVRGFKEKKPYIVLDGEEKKDNVIDNIDERWSFFFDSDSKNLYCIARLGNEIWRMVEEVK